MNTDVWAVLPLKSLTYAKRRLRLCLSPAQRRRLSERLYLTALEALCGALPPAQVLVVSHDRSVLATAGAHGAQGLCQAGYGLNDAVQQGIAWACTAGAGAALVLLADLPLVTADELSRLLAAGGDLPGVVLAPGQRDGTHALLVRPAGALRPTFGRASLTRHCNLAAHAGLPITIFDSPSLAFDVDVMEDLRRALECRPALLEPDSDASDFHLPDPWPAGSAAGG